MAHKLSPILKYPGGKERELKYIIPCLPANIHNYYEPFVGGGAVFFALNANRHFINDKSTDLIGLYTAIKEQDPAFFNTLIAINNAWKILSEIADQHMSVLLDIYSMHESTLPDAISHFINDHTNVFIELLQPKNDHITDNFIYELNRSIKSKMIRMKMLEAKKNPLPHEDKQANIEGSIKAAFYYHMRYLLNNRASLNLSDSNFAAIYLFIRQTCYSSMFRYNGKGEFNVPYGGISYNSNNFDKKLSYYRNPELIHHLNNSVLHNLDFYDFMTQNQPNPNDFVFVDPPYDSDFSTYDQNSFVCHDQERLANYLINECPANFMLVIKNTDFIAHLYTNGTNTANGNQLHIHAFDKHYFVSFMDRNQKDTEHLLITNYEVDWKGGEE